MNDEPDEIKNIPRVGHPLTYSKTLWYTCLIKNRRESRTQSHILIVPIILYLYIT